jgi:UDP-N-acetylmuramyl pentapeptide phosphotransferase/UDP-N-acetylglucosamine-1-phosphate transferase
VGFKGLIAATAAVALMTAPTVAAAQSVQVAPATESVSEGSELRGGFIIPLIAIVAIILGILAWNNDDDDDLPTTP